MSFVLNEKVKTPANTAIRQYPRCKRLRPDAALLILGLIEPTIDRNLLWPHFLPQPCECFLPTSHLLDQVVDRILVLGSISEPFGRSSEAPAISLA